MDLLLHLSFKVTLTYLKKVNYCIWAYFSLASEEPLYNIWLTGRRVTLFAVAKHGKSTQEK